MIYQREFIFVIYVNDVIFVSPSHTSIDQAIMEIGLKFDIDDQGTLNNYIGLNIESLLDNKIKLSQPHLIDQIVKRVNVVQRSPP